MSWSKIHLQFQNINLAEGPQVYQRLNMWYSNVLIELFQLEFGSSQRSETLVDKFMPHCNLFKNVWH
jgi:hypothetical protein